MVIQGGPRTPPRMPLSRERVLRTAVDLADRGGIEALSMRKLGQELGVDAMSLYHHVRNKDDILDGIADAVLSEIDVRATDADWKTALRGRIIAARTIMLRHPWAPGVIESRGDPGPATLRYMEGVLDIVSAAGFSLDLTHHAMHVLGSRILGFNQELFEDSSQDAPGPGMPEHVAREMAARYPRITELAMAVSHEGGLGGCDDDVEFAFGLDLILDGLERLRGSV